MLGGINMALVAIAPRFPQAGETVVGSRFMTYPGGKGANQAVAAARMGARTAMVGRVGDDMFGPQLREAMAPGASSGIAIIEIDGSAQNRIIQVLGANETCGEPEAQRVALAMGRASTLLLQLEVSIDLSLCAAKDATALGKTVILDPGPVRTLPQEFYACCNVITPNETEAQALVGFPVDGPSSAARAASRLLDWGVRMAVIKLGAQGVYYATEEESEHVPPFPVVSVDSVAAGDAFNGALAVALVEGNPLSRAIRIAAAAGALAVTKSGAQDSMPTRQEVEALLQGSG